MNESTVSAPLFIVFEGLDGSGKSSVIRHIEQAFVEQGRKVILANDPPLVEPWPKFKEYFERGQQIDRIAEAFMLVAARIDNSRRVIREALDAGSVVLVDRYCPSWLAYQQVRLSDRMGSEEARMFLRTVQTILETYHLVVKPDRIIYLEGDLDIFAERLRERGEGSKYDNINF